MLKVTKKPGRVRGNAGPKRGRPRKHPEGSLTALIIRVPKELHAQLKRLAVDEGRSLNDVLTDVLSGWCARQGLRRLSRRR